MGRTRGLTRQGSSCASWGNLNYITDLATWGGATHAFTHLKMMCTDYCWWYVNGLDYRPTYSRPHRSQSESQEVRLLQSGQQKSSTLAPGHAKQWGANGDTEHRNWQDVTRLETGKWWGAVGSGGEHHHRRKIKDDVGIKLKIINSRGMRKTAARTLQTGVERPVRRHIPVHRKYLPLGFWVNLVSAKVKPSLSPNSHRGMGYKSARVPKVHVRIGRLH